MIQFNLLPDVKLEYIKARRRKHLMMLISIATGALAVFVLVMLFLVVGVFQKKHMNNLTREAETLTQQLRDTPNLNKILTVQNQLNNLTNLHDKKPVATRLFNYLVQITPAQVSIAKLDLSFVDSTISITGAANDISTINTFVDTMKFTTYKASDSSEPVKAFSSVVLASFGRDDKGASYHISLKFDPLIFDSKQDAKLIIPNQITTRSETEKPADLFQPNSNTQGTQQ